MEPKLPSPERAPNISPETGDFALPQAEESGAKLERSERSPDQITERAGEQHQPTVSAAKPIALPTPIVNVTDDSATQAVTDDDLPIAAADDDLIEKEWVDKAKKIIAETKDDPHMREQEVGKLQADYLRKRYGKELGETT